MKVFYHRVLLPEENFGKIIASFIEPYRHDAFVILNHALFRLNTKESVEPLIFVKQVLPYRDKKCT
jgi:hypothetical protein